jgi:enoyl-CoA hydratase/carnithine racemase
MTAPLLIETKGEITTLTLNRPSKRNALSRDMLATLRAAFASASDGKSHAMILTGSGGCFSAGADMGELDGTTRDAEFDQVLSDVAGAIQDGPFIAIAAIEGYCIGAGLDLACACDVRIVATDAVFELPALRLGLLYNPTAVARMHRLLPGATMRRLLLLGERIEGRDAGAAGIATQIVEPQTTGKVSNKLAQRCIASPRALTETKRLLAALEQGNANIAKWSAVQKELLGSPERQAALASAKTRLRK